MKVNSNTILVAVVCITIAGMIATFGYTYLEPYYKTKKGSPTEAEKENMYLALDRWLERTGHKTRIERSGNAKSVQEAPEDVVVIYTSAFDFEDSKMLIDAIKAGKKVSIMRDKILNDTYYQFIAAVKAEIKAQHKLYETSIAREYFNKLFDPNAQSEKINWISGSIKEDAIAQEIKKTSAKEENKKKILDEDDYYDTGYYNFKYLGRGIINTEYPHSTNSVIDNKHYAKDAWDCTGGLDTDNKGIYIIRSKETENGTLWKKKTEITLWNLLAQKGAMLPILIPAFAMIIFGFWIILLPFGKNKKEYEIHGKPIRMRFLAEASFYKKHNLLNKYLKYLPKVSGISVKEKITTDDLKKLLGMLHDKDRDKKTMRNTSKGHL
ncbi:MAG: hypothetical protein Ta2B_06050 [Termitinemataceae bacterium]|nr:MAG: hypothetical protein Ta2B_06050 [Termitinemataceae bacterium]